MDERDAIALLQQLVEIPSLWGRKRRLSRFWRRRSGSGGWGLGKDALKFVNQEAGKRLRLRGVYAKVVQPGVIRVGDTIRKIR
jgi:hypothetical protein